MSYKQVSHQALQKKMESSQMNVRLLRELVNNWLRFEKQPIAPTDNQKELIRILLNRWPWTIDFFQTEPFDAGLRFLMDLNPEYGNIRWEPFSDYLMLLDGQGRSSYFPFYTLDELHHALSDLLKDIKKHQTSLIETGFTPSFHQCNSWIQALGSLLYPSVYFSFETKDNGLSEESFQAHVTNGYPLEFLGQTHAEFIKTYREKWFQLKVQLLEKLIDSFQRKNPAGVWKDSFTKIKECLLYEEVSCLLEIDDVYRSNVQTTQEAFHLYGCCNGGLSETITLIGHIGNELDGTQIFHTMKSNIVADSRGDEMYEVLLRLPRVREYWQGFAAKVNDDFEDELCEEIVTRQKVQRKMAKQYQPFMESLSRITQETLHLTGELPSLSPKVQPTQKELFREEETYIFRKEGEYWRIRYKDYEVRMKDSKGLQDIHTLLSHPLEEINVLVLAGHPDQKFLSNQADNILDSKSIVFFKRKIEELNEQINSNGANQQDCADLISQSKSIQAELKRAFKGTTFEKFLNNRDRARKAVTKRIKKALKRIENEDELLWRHLTNSITFGSECTYVPDNKIEWGL